MISEEQKQLHGYCATLWLVSEEFIPTNITSLPKIAAEMVIK